MVFAVSMIRHDGPCEITRDFYTVLSPSDVVEDARLLEMFQVFFSREMLAYVQSVAHLSLHRLKSTQNNGRIS